MEPTTPKKRKNIEKGEVEESPAKKSRSMSQTPNKGRSGNKAIPDREEDLSLEDRMMLDMKERGSTWKEISQEWTKMTGQTHSSLPTRYIRIKAAIARVDDEHLEALQKAKADVEREIEEDIKAIRRQFWTKVAAKMEEDVGKKYDQSTLEKAVKKLQVKERGSTTMKEENEDPFEED